MMSLSATSCAPPPTSFAVDATKCTETLHRDLISSVRQFIPEWVDYKDEDVDVQRLTGGLTNVLYTLTPGRDKRRTVIVRVYGEGTSLFVDRAIENTIFRSLSSGGVATQFVGAFSNGRVEGYVDATALTPAQMAHPDLYPRIAAAVAQLHAQTVVGITKEAYLWSKLQSFFDLAEDSMKRKAATAGGSGGGADFREQLKTLRKEMTWLREQLEEIEGGVRQRLAGPLVDRREEMVLRGAQFAFSTVLCHNDLLSGNILLSNDVQVASEEGEKESDEEEKMSSQSSSSGDITLIDFEYAGYNPRGWDIGNHFNEYAGFDFNITRDFPTQPVRRAFLTSYVLAAEAAATPETRQLLSEVVRDRESTEAFVAGMDDITCKYCLVSHLFWGVWATIQSAISTIDFDFAGYAQLRFDGYSFHKREFFADGSKSAEALRSCQQ
jgi:ethanolamine kinase